MNVVTTLHLMEGAKSSLLLLTTADCLYRFMSQEYIDQITEHVYQFICDYLLEHGIAPTQREIGAGCYIGDSTVLRYLDRLEMQGRISRQPGKARSIRVINSVNSYSG